MENRKEIRKLDPNSYLIIEKSFEIAEDMFKTRRDIYVISLFVFSSISVILLGFKLIILLFEKKRCKVVSKQERIEIYLDKNKTDTFNQGDECQVCLE